MHAACCIAFRHLLMNDAATGRHPLHVSGADDTAIANAVAMRHSSGQHVGDRLDSTVRMPRESRQVILWNIVAEIIQQEERVEVFCVPKTKRAVEMHARAFESLFGFDEPLNGSNGHLELRG